jgi:gamma-glutamylaminecyclotransferase
MQRVFVYGTLKRGFPNHVPVMEHARYLGRCRTLEAYPLVIGGRWFTPCLLDEPGAGCQVLGEEFEVDEATLTALDALESVGKARGYHRVQIAVEDAQGGQQRPCWAYLKRRADVPEIHSGPLAEYPPDPRYIVPARRPANPDHVD